MKKLISFSELKNVCDRRYYPAKKRFVGCIVVRSESDKCCAKKLSNLEKAEGMR